MTRLSVGTASLPSVAAAVLPASCGLGLLSIRSSSVSDANAADDGGAGRRAETGEHADHPYVVVGLAGLEGWDPAFPSQAAPQTLGTAANPPVFYRDPTAAKAVRYIDRAGPCWAGNIAGVMSMNVGGGQNIVWLDAMWDVQTTGLTGNGSAVDVDAIVTSCHPFNS